MPYSLRDGISFCDVDGRLFFLDIDADRYFALSASAEASPRRVMTGAPLDASSDGHLGGLVGRDILRTSTPPVRPIAPCTAPPIPTSSLLDAADPPARLWTTLRAVAAITASKARLRRRGLRHNLAAAVARRRADIGSAPPRTADTGSLRPIAAAFDRAGRLVSAHDHCLAQSLAVARCIFAAGGTAHLILGVTLGPFGAHCWVQSGTVLVNDRIDRVAAYTPILVL